jgi:dihydropteroate synthase
MGFGKALEHNLTIISRIKSFKSLDLPIVFGASRKSFIDQIDTSEPLQRLGGSLAAAALAMQESIDIIRVHDVKEHLQYYKVSKALEQAKRS